MNKFLIYSATTLLAIQSQLTFSSETVIVRSITENPQAQQIVTQQPVQIITTTDGQSYYQTISQNNTNTPPVANAVYQVVTQQPQPVQQVVYQQVMPAGTQQVVTQQAAAQQPPVEEPKKKGFLSSLARNVGGTMLQVALPGPIGNIAGGIVKGSD